MSLKAFHVFFVALSVLLAAGFGGWALNEYRNEGGVANLILGVTSLLGGIGLIVYGRWFLRKLRGVSYI
ncbi:MAG: hypothetical protein IID40_02675 [Planctomycetes bacterium]|nr:hypothetical protein [Planctomycetota bacterium]